MKQVAEPLLTYLRGVGSPDLAYREEPRPIALGAETWVFGLELRDAPPELTRVRMEMNPLEVPRILQAVGGLVRGRMTRVFERAYAEGRRLDEDLVTFYEVLLSLWLLVTIGEHRRSPRTDQTEEGRSPNQWLLPGNEIPLIRHCRRLADLALELP